MKTKNNAINLRASDDFVVVMENTWRLFKGKYPEYDKVNNLTQFIVCALLNEMNNKPIGKKIIEALDTGDIPELSFWKSKEIEGGVEDVFKNIKEQVKKRK